MPGGFAKYGAPALTGATSGGVPAAHAASHAAGGSDPVTLTEAQITNLVSDLAAKAPIAAQLKPTTVKTANYTAVPGNYVPVDTTSGVIIVTLPTAPADGTVIAVKRVVGATNAVTVNAGGSDVFDVAAGTATSSVSVLNLARVFIYAAAAAIWYIDTSLPVSAVAQVGPAQVVTKTTTYTAVNRDIVLASASGGAWVLTLPAVASGAWVTVKKTDGTVNAVTITPASGTIDGAATLGLTVQHTSRDLVSDGTNWFVV